eukprot:gene16911-biopygen18835
MAAPQAPQKAGSMLSQAENATQMRVCSRKHAVPAQFTARDGTLQQTRRRRWKTLQKQRAAGAGKVQISAPQAPGITESAPQAPENTGWSTKRVGI